MSWNSLQLGTLLPNTQGTINNVWSILIDMQSILQQEQTFYTLFTIGSGEGYPLTWHSFWINPMTPSQHTW